MSATIPQFVEHGNTTICGLQRNARPVHSEAMENQSQQYEIIGKRLAAIRQAFSDLNQKQWAERHGFQLSQWNNWELGARRIPVESAEKLCGLYGLTLDFIYLGRRDGLSEKASKVL